MHWRRVINENFTALVQREARLLVEENRESGDRGTSILYMTNMVSSLAVIVLLFFREKGISEKTIKKLLQDYFKGEGELFDIVAEGDDGEQFFSKLLLNMLGYCANGRPDPAAFGKDLDCA